MLNSSEDSDPKTLHSVRRAVTANFFLLLAKNALFDEVFRHISRFASPHPASFASYKAFYSSGNGLHLFLIIQDRGIAECIVDMDNSGLKFGISMFHADYLYGRLSADTLDLKNYVR